MANNRMWLTCSQCPDARFHLARHQSNGWSAYQDDGEQGPPGGTRAFGADLDRWLAAHNHNLYGTEIGLSKSVEDPLYDDPLCDERADA